MDREKEIEEKALVVSPALAELRPASLTHFAGLIDRCGRSERVEGTAIRLDVSCALLAASRRDGGVRHRFGVLEFDACCIGAMLTHADRELHAVLFDLGAPEMKNFFMEAEAQNAFRVLVVAETGDLRLMLPPRSEGMDMLFEATRKARSVPALELAGAAAEAARFVVSEQGLVAMNLTPGAACLRVVHFVLTESRVAEASITTREKRPLH